AAGTVVIIPTYGAIAAKRVAVGGLGKAESFTVEQARKASAEAVKALNGRGARVIATVAHGAGIGGLDPAEAARATVEGAMLALYRFDKYQTNGDRDRARVTDLIVVDANATTVAAVQAGAERGRILAEATLIARDLQNEPANVLTPIEFGERAKALGSAVGLAVEVFDEAWMRAKGMGALLGVGQGSAQPPRLIVLRYDAGDSRPAVGLVGKGITFDTGGISIKPASGMELMKTDMSGGAAVIGAMIAIARLKPNRNVVGIIPAAENMPGGNAQRPGDIVRTMHGKTIEVINTDAEGRLILADALAYAQELGLSPIIDLATLTGAVTVALGRLRTGAYTNDPATYAIFERASELAGERMWRMPLDDDYFDLIKSEVADMKNVGEGGAGSIIGAIFLRKMVDSTPWIHLDIAGTARALSSSGYTPKGGTGVGARSLVHFVEALAAADR
ncbi:MAG: leucyl aminopeptidase, partial [Dehalococcoidia bacterium]|nr:leucyl aminopeptidase [Dehalococcoidia bacterium]